jgi:molybdate transport system regulatory protein
MEPRIEVRLRINFGPGSALGPGKIALLERIAVGGSLARAAADLDMSYRRAWALLQELEHAFGESVAVTTKGGASGGGAVLTPFAFRIIAAYRAAERTAASAATAEFASVVRATRTRKRESGRRRVKKTRRRGSRRARAPR